MSERVKRSSGWLFGLVITAALVFGATQAFAKPVQLACPNDGWNTLGSCTSNANCQDKCNVVHQPNGSSTGRCTAFCCKCLL